MPDMPGEEKVFPPSQNMLRPVPEPEAGLTFKHNDPFVGALVVPLSLRGHMPHETMRSTRIPFPSCSSVSKNSGAWGSVTPSGRSSNDAMCSPLAGIFAPRM